MTTPAQTIDSRPHAANTTPVLPILEKNRYSRFWVTLSLILADVGAFLLSGFLAVAGRYFLGLGWKIELYPQVFLLMAPCIIIYQLGGMYSTLGLGSVEELRKLTIVTSTVMLGVTGLTFFLRNAEEYSRMIVALTWVLSLVSVPFFRSTVRTLASNFPFWGKPVVIIGFRGQGPSLVQYLRSNRRLGFSPILVLDGFGGDHISDAEIPVFPAMVALRDDNLSKRLDVDTALLIASDVPAELMNSVAQRQIGGFRHLFLIPNLGKFKTVGVSTVEIGGVLGLKAKFNLYNKTEAIIKRILDIIIVTVGLVVSAPLFLLIALLIKLDSRGGIFYAHTRIGKGDKKFRMWKFRTMVTNADKVLIDTLYADHDLLSEWNQFHKLKDDPRMTRVGKFLRRFSLDELPQLWNVLLGEMSLVGPRPIVEAEVDKYGDSFEFYTRVKPGITGLWQVSGRNNTAYVARVSLDEYYVRNWSVWMDVNILTRTPWAVIRRDGAY